MIPQTGEKAFEYISGDNNKTVMIGFQILDKLVKAVSGHGLTEFYELFGKNIIDLSVKMVCVIRSGDNVNQEK